MVTSTTGTGTVTITYDCPYRSICSDNGVRCESCANNPKRSYYIPVTPYIPYVPYYPYWQPTIWYANPSGGTTCESHYQST